MHMLNLSFICITLKLASFVFTNYVDFAAYLSYASLVILVIYYARYILKCLDRLVVTILFGFAIIGYCIFVSLINSVPPEDFFTLILPVCIGLAYFPMLKDCSIETIDFCFKATSILILLKTIYNLIIYVMIYRGMIDFGKLELEPYLGEIGLFTTQLDSLGIFKLYDKSLLFIPLYIYALSTSKVLIIVQWLLLSLAVFFSGTLSFYFVYVIVIVYLCICFKKGSSLLPILFMGIIFVIAFEANIVEFMVEKSRSVDIKLEQYAGLSQLSLVGQGIGSRLIPGLKDDDLVIENSYLYMVFAFGPILIIPIAILMGFVLYKLFNVRVASYNSSLMKLNFISFLISSGSNIFIFSGSVLIILYLSWIYINSKKYGRIHCA